MIKRDAEIMIPLKYLNSFRRVLAMHLIAKLAIAKLVFSWYGLNKKRFLVAGTAASKSRTKI